MFGFHASVLDDPQLSRLGSGDGVVVDLELEPDDLDVVVFDRLIDDACHLEAGAEHLLDADLPAGVSHLSDILVHDPPRDCSTGATDRPEITDRNVVVLGN